MSSTIRQYPAGALLRVSDICRTPARFAADGTLIEPERQGLLPINRSTWYKWVKDGKVPPGRKIGENTTVWPIEVVLAIGQVEDQPA